MAKNTLQTILIARNEEHTTAYTNSHITSSRQMDVEHGTNSIVQTLNLHDLETNLRYLYNTKSFRKSSSIFNMEHNASLGTNTNIHIRTGQMMA